MDASAAFSSSKKLIKPMNLMKPRSPEDEKPIKVMLPMKEKGRRKKTRIFYGKADHREKCENFDPFFSMEYDSMILKPHSFSL